MAWLGWMTIDYQRRFCLAGARLAVNANESASEMRPLECATCRSV